MTRDIIDIQDFTILVEEAQSITTTTDACCFDEPVIGVAFYGLGNVELTVKYVDKEKSFHFTKGMALSFYADNQVQFIHTINEAKPLQCIVIVTAIRNLEKLPNQEGELFGQWLHELTHPSDHYVEGPTFFMAPEMLTIVEQVFNTQYEGKIKMMFFKSQMTLLLSHFFGQLSSMKKEIVRDDERKKLYEAKEILTQQLDAPPSLSELAKQIGLNSFKLKKEFKALFGLPVFKYLQQERLTKAHELLQQRHTSVQEAAWHVGYDSLSSFSNAFAKKYGYRPSEIRRVN